MPRIIVTADDSDQHVLHSERVTPSDFDTDHFRAQLAERVAWAVADDVASDPPAQEGRAAGTGATTRAPAHAG